MAFYTTLIEELLTEVDLLLNEYVTKGYEALAGYLEVPLGVAIVFFFVCYGVGLTQGWIKGSVSGMTKSLFKIGMIYYLGMNWGHFSEYVSALFYDAAGHIGDVLVNASPIPLPTLGGTGINGALQSILIELMKISQWILDSGSWRNWVPLIEGCAIGAVGIFLVMFAVLEIVIAKCMLSILFVTAPLFIAFTLFKTTHAFFDRWLGACVGYAMLMIFVCAGLGIVVALDQWALADMYLNKAFNVKTIDAGVLILVSLVCLGILKRVAGLAMNIGGSVTTMSGGEMFAGAVGGALGGAGMMKGAMEYMTSANSLPGRMARAPFKGASFVAKDIMKDLRNGMGNKGK